MRRRGAYRGAYSGPYGPDAAYGGSYSGTFSPGLLRPYSWYDASIGGSSTQITDSSGNGRSAATYGASAGAPTWLPYTTPAVYLTGVALSYVSAPDSAALSFSNDIEVVCRIKAVDWTAAANQTIAGKYVTTGNQRSWRFYVSTTGVFGLTASVDGTAVTSCLVTPTSALTDNAWVWLRLRLDLTNGSNSVGTVETAADTGSNDDIPTVWTANGTATSTTLAGVFDSTAPVEIGSFGSGASERFNGWIGRVIVRSGFDGTTVADFNATLCGQTGYTASSPATTWTVNRPTSGRKTVVQSPAADWTRSVVSIAAGNYVDIPADALPTMSGAGWSNVVVVRQWGTPISSGRWSSVKNGATFCSTLYNFGTTAAAQHFLGAASSTNESYSFGQSLVHLGAGDGGATAYWQLNSASRGSFSATNANATAGRIGADPGAVTSTQDFDFHAYLTFNRVISTAEFAQLVAYYRGGV